MDKLTGKIFYEKEILSVENFYRFFDRKKIITFVPFNFLEKLALEMSNAGAGLIGNYEMCSFRTEGIGTFKPNEKTKPFSGKKKILSYEEELKLEMECAAESLNKVIDAILRNHPYEEPAYEIYDFKKRDKKNIGITINLLNKIKFKEIIVRTNSGIECNKTDINHKVNKIAMTSCIINDNIINSARFINCGCLIKVLKNNFKLFKI
ncbi:MAG: hypothetical protein M3R36_18540 [Bacteroidota bacterium]|nr:hypothetical protein [Bacteroidota bacterium]